MLDVKKDSRNVLVVCVIAGDEEPCTAVGTEAMKAEKCMASTLSEAFSFIIPDAKKSSLLDFHFRFAYFFTKP